MPEILGLIWTSTELKNTKRVGLDNIETRLLLYNRFKQCMCQFLSRISLPMHAERDIVLPILSVRPSVCPSVCQSVQCWYCVKTNGHIVTNILHSDRSIIIVFSSPPLSHNSKGSLIGGVIQGDLGTLCKYCHFSETVRDRAIVTMDH